MDGCITWPLCELGFLRNHLGFLIYIGDWVNFWKRVSLHFEMTLAYVGVSIVLTINLCKWCEHVLFAYQVFDKLFIGDYGFDSLFLICFKSCGFNVNKVLKHLG